MITLDHTIRLERDALRLFCSPSSYRDFRDLKNDPVRYAESVLNVRLTPVQQEIAQAAAESQWVLVPSGHDTGKTFLMAVLVCWWYDTRSPSVCLTTAPKLDQVRDLLWKEVRALRARAKLGGFPGPKALRLQDSPKHFAKGVTANSSAGFQGQHESHVLVILDEAEGVESQYWRAAKTMANGAGHAIIATYNPYSSGSQAAIEEQARDANGNSTWKIIRMSSADHPNIALELEGKEPLIPQAVRLEKLRRWLADWTEPLLAHESPIATDFEFPPKSGKWHRPSATFEAAVLGRRPTNPVDSVWSTAMVDFCCRRELPLLGKLQIGCDVAYFGDDDTAIHIRVGGVSVHHERAKGWDHLQTAQRLRVLATKFGERFGVPNKQVPICIDSCGNPCLSVELLRDGWNAVSVNVSQASPDEEKYPNLRSALWFDLAEEGRRGNLSFALLPREIQDVLRLELPSQLYQFDGKGRRVCLDKATTKSTLGRSPDNADAVMLSYFSVGSVPDLVAGVVGG